VRLSRQWDDDIDWSDYPRRFAADQVPCTAPRVAGDAESRAAITELGGAEALRELERLMAAGGHEMVVLHVSVPLAMRTCNNVHSSGMGTNNGFHAVRAGGVRRHEVDEPELDVFVDGLNLGRGMSYKNAAARIPFGGCKMTVQVEPFALDDAERLGFLAWSIDTGAFFTGPDMGFPPELADALRARFTRNIVGGPAGSMGPTGVPTARGTVIAMRECARAMWGHEDLSGRCGAVQGLGAVGLPLARHMKEAGMHLVVADRDPTRVEAAREALGDVDVVDAGQILAVECDVLAPCAVGGVFDADAIGHLHASVVCGSANNQLRAVSRDEELVLADRMAERGVMYPPEWMHNIAGVVAGFEEYARGDAADVANIEPHLERVCGDGIRELLRAASESERTPTELAYDQVEARIGGRVTS
jgi:glutamate dehydrogenase/leucine dehydrogenase